VDSKLVANQVNRIYIAKESSMIRYLEKVKNMANTFKGFSIKQIPRGENKKADALSKIASTSFAHPSKHVLVEELREKAIDEKEILAEKLAPITSPWPFYKWGIDIAGPFPEGPEKEPMRGDQGTFGGKNKNWVEEVSHVLWAHRTMIKSSNGETPFSLTYETKAVIPAEIGMPTLRTTEVDVTKNNEALGISLDLREEKREQAAIQEARNKAKMEEYYNARILAVVEEEGHTWMTLFYEYLTEGVLPEEKKKERTVRRKAGRYAVINEVLYKRYFLGPWLRCVRPLQANYVLREIHEGSCSMHAGQRSVVAKASRSSYFWPTMHTDAKNLIRECKDCQVHRQVPKNPQEKLTPITSPWPFYKWGIDIAGPFSEGLGKVKFRIVAIDYFTKWIEAKPVASIIGTQVKKFVWDNIVCKFELPGEVISDNRKQFRDNPFKDWCKKINIRQCFTSVKHPQANGLVERANKSLGEGFKARLGEKIKIGWKKFHTEQAAIQEARNKAKMEEYYNARVRSTIFRPGDFVYRNNEASHAKDGGKLGPKWDGPYEVTEALGKGAYKLKDRNEHTLPRTWNIRNLKKCYIHEM
nr:reverse transcriptase domain-containing protein [Tanacetum cinerariifolium]